MRLLRGLMHPGEPPRSTSSQISATVRWTTRLRGHTAHGIALSPATQSVYSGDGWGATYSAMRIRRYDLATGQEVASFRAFNALRCSTLLEGQKAILAVSDSKLFELDTMTLEERQRWDRRIPRYGNTVAVVDRMVVLADWLNPRVGIVDLQTGQVRRRPAPAMTQIVSGRRDPLLVGGSKEGETWEISLPSARVHVLLRTPPALHAALAPDGDLLFILVGLRGKVTANSSAPGGPSSELRTYHLDGGAVDHYRLPTAVSTIACGTSHVLFGGPDVVISSRLPLEIGGLSRWASPHGHQVVAMDADTGLVLTLVQDVESGAADLTCWELHRG